MKHPVIYSNYAIEDIDETLKYIGNNLKNPVAADNLILEIEDIFNLISEFPESMPLVEDEVLSNLSIRIAYIKNYCVFYIFDQKNIYVLRFLYKKRNWNELLKTETINNLD